jgi:hypothetical protein
MEALERNPFIEPEDYYKQLNENVDKLKNDPRIIEFDKICFELFEMNEYGRKFTQHIHDNFLIPALVQKGAPTYQLDLMWADGFKDFARMLLNCVASHKHRIAAGNL